LLDEENESLLRKVLVTVESTYLINTNNSIVEDGNPLELPINLVHKICLINIDSKLKWNLMDGIVSYVFKRYLQKIDPKNLLGLDRSSIDCYLIGDSLKRKLNDNSNLPDLLPYGYFVGKNFEIKIILKDSLENLDALCFDTLIPKYLLEDYISLLIKDRFIAITSLQKFGKTFLTNKLVQFLSKK
jgi:hypothetical protein